MLLNLAITYSVGASPCFLWNQLIIGGNMVDSQGELDLKHWVQGQDFFL